MILCGLVVEAWDVKCDLIVWLTWIKFYFIVLDFPDLTTLINCYLKRLCRYLGLHLCDSFLCYYYDVHVTVFINIFDLNLRFNDTSRIISNWGIILLKREYADRQIISLWFGIFQIRVF